MWAGIGIEPHFDSVAGLKLMLCLVLESDIGQFQGSWTLTSSGN